MPLPHPTLVIGLGGTGQWVACHVLKELMDLYGLNDPNELNTSPKIGGRVRILAFDTDGKNVAAVGHGQGARVGQIKLPNSMILPVGAAIHTYAKDIAAGNRPWISSWFDAKWFLAQANANALLNLAQGAGQFRPLGRVAVPYNLTEAGGGISNVLTTAIQGIQGTFRGEENSIVVCIVGSLCGGTGAGMVADLAHLVQMIAGNTSLHTRAYLVLPNAFEGTVPPSADGGVEIRRRAFAAMRELRRFAREVNYEIGYPMYYAGPGTTNAVQRGRSRTALFELLYYFDATLRRDDDANALAKVEVGMAPLIAEAILLWIDGQTSTTLLSHTANLTAAKLAKVQARALDAQAAVAGGMGVFSVQLPIQQIIEEWTYDLGRDVLKRFLGVPEVNGEDATTKTVVRLRENWAGGQEGMSGSEAARADWEGKPVGGNVAGEFAKDVLRTGRAGREGPATTDRRRIELQNRTLSDWQTALCPQASPSAEDQKLTDEFLDPQEKRARGQDAAKAQVFTTDHQPGDAKKMDKRTPNAAAERIKRQTAEYLDQRLGRVDRGANRRGGDDRDPEGLYPLMLRRWAEMHLEDYRVLLRSWVAESLNGTADSQRAAGETPENALKQRAGKLGFTLALLQELSAMLGRAEEIYRQVEEDKLKKVVDLRNSAQVSELVQAMERNVGKQEAYLKWQQQVLEMERGYACARAARWAAGGMLAFTKDVWERLQTWERSLCKDGGLYQAVWQGQSQAATSLSTMKDLSAVREIVEIPAIKQQRYQYYAEQQANALGETLNALRWEVKQDQVYDRAKGRYVPALTIGLQLGNQPLSDQGPDVNKRLFTEQCRGFFGSARTYETVLGWLQAYYNDSTDDRQLATLAARLATKGKITLRTQDAANPFRFAYVRAQWRDTTEEQWLQNLKAAITANMPDANNEYTQPVGTSDPFRLTLLLFNELIDVEKLTAYSEGRNGKSGAGGYIHLPAKSNGTNLARQVLHVFAAERNAAVVEERLGRLLPDKIVALLEDEDRFRQFVQVWAYGKKGENDPEQLLNQYRLPDDDLDNPGQWVYRLTTGPFEDDFDDFTGYQRPAQHWWLGKPSRDQPALLPAAETFCLGGVDKWQAQQPKRIDLKGVLRSIGERREALLSRSDIGSANPQLKQTLDGITDPERQGKMRLKLAEYEHLQRLNKELMQTIIPGMERDARRADLQHLDGGDDAGAQLAVIEQLTVPQLDPDLYRLMTVIIAEEMGRLREEIAPQQK